jgi:hypothetical protein
MWAADCCRLSVALPTWLLSGREARLAAQLAATVRSLPRFRRREAVQAQGLVPMLRYLAVPVAAEARQIQQVQRETRHQLSRRRAMMVAMDLRQARRQTGRVAAVAAAVQAWLVAMRNSASAAALAALAQAAALAARLPITQEAVVADIG